jgi:hypothetical protein
MEQRPCGWPRRSLSGSSRTSTAAKVRLEFKGSTDIRQLGQMIATYVL